MEPEPQGDDSEIKLNLGIFIVGYKDKESMYIENIKKWESVFDKVVLFTDSRLDDNAEFWSSQTEFKIYDFATMEIPILDWYFKHAEFLKGKYIAKYLTFYSDL